MDVVSNREKFPRMTLLLSLQDPPAAHSVPSVISSWLKTETKSTLFVGRLTSSVLACADVMLKEHVSRAKQNAEEVVLNGMRNLNMKIPLLP